MSLALFSTMTHLGPFLVISARGVQTLESGPQSFIWLKTQNIEENQLRPVR